MLWRFRLVMKLPMGCQYDIKRLASLPCPLVNYGINKLLFRWNSPNNDLPPREFATRSLRTITCQRSVHNHNDPFLLLRSLERISYPRSKTHVLHMPNQCSLVPELGLSCFVFLLTEWRLKFEDKIQVSYVEMFIYKRQKKVQRNFFSKISY